MNGSTSKPARRRDFLRYLGASAFPAAAALPAAGADPALNEVSVFRAGADGYHTYRIPALLVTRRGTLLAFCEGRKDNSKDHGDIDMVLKRSTDGGRSWSPMQVVFEEGGTAKITIGNPCPVQDSSTGTIWLPFCRDNDRVFVTSSKDEGVTWTTPVEITAGVKKPDWSWYATGPGIGIQVSRGRYKGRMVIPCDHREVVNGQPVKMSHVFFSDDRGATWQLGGSVELHTDECQVAEVADGSLLINMRNYWERDGKQPEKGRKRTVARSTDGGATWNGFRFDETLIEPVCQASLVRYPRKLGKARAPLLFSNPASRDKRVRMTVRLSYDEGLTWPVEKLVYEGPSAYSSLGVLRDGTVALLYERGARSTYEEIALARFPAGWLASK